jgi:hypothetical protein
MGLSGDQKTIEYLIDLLVDVQTVRSCQTAAELDPQFSVAMHAIDLDSVRTIPIAPRRPVTPSR